MRRFWGSAAACGVAAWVGGWAGFLCNQFFLELCAEIGFRADWILEFGGGRQTEHPVDQSECRNPHGFRNRRAPRDNGINGSIKMRLGKGYRRNKGPRSRLGRWRQSALGDGVERMKEPELRVSRVRVVY